jgi:Skp family chaperone for outer membrane proteins
VPSSSSDNGAAARREHEATMQRYKQENQKIRDDIKALDRKYR